MKNIFILTFISFFSLHAQENNRWDDTRSEDWPEESQVVKIISSIDNKEQPAYYFKAESNEPRPLIVSLHTWSGGYAQKDPLVWQCIALDYNYIHPHFRGQNNSFEACGSELAIQDIDDAIQFALDNAAVDSSNIHIIGVSGGGYSTLLCYMKTQQPVTTFSAWVPISNLVDWYAESKGRKNKYAKDVAMSTTGLIFEDDDYFIDTAEALKRSPVFMDTPTDLRKNAKLYIYAGIHDGYTGSVPITQSLKFYNKVVQSFENDIMQPIPECDMIKMLASRSFPNDLRDSIAGRKIHYKKSFDSRVSITIFEGTHEMLEGVALDHIPGKKILILGDSNGAIKEGWVDQLKSIRFNDFIYNTSISGNTVGFDNLGNKKLNTLRNADNYLSMATERLHGLDMIIVMLGTNDCKAIFADSLKIIEKNYNRLIAKIKQHPYYLNHEPVILLVSPPPMGKDTQLQEKYIGGNNRINQLIPAIKKIARKNNCIFIDTNRLLRLNFSELTKDGVHLNEIGQSLIAGEINRVLKELE
jgi:lysophospholipase L1-like esterase